MTLSNRAPVQDGAQEELRDPLQEQVPATAPQKVPNHLRDRVPQRAVQGKWIQGDHGGQRLGFVNLYLVVPDSVHAGSSSGQNCRSARLGLDKNYVNKMSSCH